MESDKFAVDIIDKYYPEGSKARDFYLPHVKSVMYTVEKIRLHNSDLKLNRNAALVGALLHDIGICKTNEPRLGCYGSAPYIQHGILGRDILISEGLTDYAPFCERHIGIGLNKEFAKNNNFPEPWVDMFPVTIEEVLVCYADKFFSKSHGELTKPKPLELIRKEIGNYGKENLNTFDGWCKFFGTDYIYDK